MNPRRYGPERCIHSPNRFLRTGAMLLAATLALAACSDDAQEPRREPTAATPATAIYQQSRLGMTDTTPPELWLASRQAGSDLKMDDARVVALKEILDDASRSFREYPRMIANRAVQLEEMLKEKNMGEPAPELVAELSRAVGLERNVESFGALCGQYFNLRMQGLDRQQALKVLASESRPSN